jgi:hypothetical protein
MGMTRLMFPAVVLALAAACGDDLEPACLPVVRAAVEVEVRDATTEELRAELARGLVQDGAFTDSLQVVRSDGPHGVASALGAAWERPGTYRIRIQREGYQPWDTSGVHVRADQCGASPVHFVARLSPAA